jgi:hypothetical protein
MISSGSVLACYPEAIYRSAPDSAPSRVHFTNLTHATKTNHFSTDSVLLRMAVPYLYGIANRLGFGYK